MEKTKLAAIEGQMAGGGEGAALRYAKVVSEDVSDDV